MFAVTTAIVISFTTEVHSLIEALELALNSQVHHLNFLAHHLDNLLNRYANVEAAEALDEVLVLRVEHGAVQHIVHEEVHHVDEASRALLVLYEVIVLFFYLV